MTVSLWIDRSADLPPLDVDLCIVGAGISGASTAWWLRDAGLRVAVVDARDVAGGATGRNAGMASHGSLPYLGRLIDLHGDDRAAELWHLSRENLARVERDLDARAVACGFRRRGTCNLATQNADLERLGAIGERVAAWGGRVRRVDAAWVEGALAMRGFAGGIVCDDDAELHPGALARGLLAESGAQYLPHHEVHALEPVRGGLELRTGVRTVRAERVVLATNAWSHTVDPWLGAHIGRVAGQVLATAPVAPFLATGCYATEPFAYLRQTPEGRVVVGGLAHAATEPAPDDPEALRPDVQAALTAFVRERFAPLADVAVDYRWGGVMGYSVDGVPLVGPIPGRPGVHCIAGFSGNGLSRAFEAARRLAVHLRGGPEPALLSTGRFAAAAS